MDSRSHVSCIATAFPCPRDALLRKRQCPITVKQINRNCGAATFGGDAPIEDPIEYRVVAAPVEDPVEY